jgi:regulator of replication initiation timing
MFGLFKKKVEKQEFLAHKNAVQTALNNAKQDVGNLNQWVEHLNSVDSGLKGDVEDIYEELSTVKTELEELKNMVSLAVGGKKLRKSAAVQTADGKQTAVYAVQNTVQTAVQTEFLDRLSISERALVMILLNSDMKLSYEDLGAMMGKDPATVRGQINGVKQKCEGLIEEQIEKNNKKRLFIPEKLRNTLLKKVKVRVKKRRG